ncbi:MAG TPA: aminoglycoside phosphotransferase family protein [Acidimicrobiales bacterium]|nr:aminoglycoside phosphotransferase family protein [Acidimicrobiales bacterium]
MTSKQAPAIDDVRSFLLAHHDEAISELEPLAGGFWSSAYGYTVGGRELVLRVGDVPEWFEMDRAAALAFAGPDLPIPEVVDVGAGLGRSYAISVRHHGRFLEAVGADESDRVGPAVVRLLEALRAVPHEPGASVSWFPPGAADTGWRAWLAAGLSEQPGHPVSGWRSKLAAEPGLDHLFVAAETRVAELAVDCPERRDLVHNDLLHANVLVAADASRVTGLFSWKCSVRGDFLYDLALCTFWAPWFPGFAAVDIWTRVMASASAADADFADAAARHHCYELQIGAHHLGWGVWVGDQLALDKVAARLTEIIERGPLAL